MKIRQAAVQLLMRMDEHTDVVKLIRALCIGNVPKRQDIYAQRNNSAASASFY